MALLRSLMKAAQGSIFDKILFTIYASLLYVFAKADRVQKYLGGLIRKIERHLGAGPLRPSVPLKRKTKSFRLGSESFFSYWNFNFLSLTKVIKLCLLVTKSKRICL